MTERSVTHHATFVIERSYDASPARVFAAFADPVAKAHWFAGAEPGQGRYELDFRVGGRERNSGGEPDGPVYTFEARYHDIVPDRRIVSTYYMHVDLHACGRDPDLGLSGDGGVQARARRHSPAVREQGTRGLLDTLDAALRERAI